MENLSLSEKLESIFGVTSLNACLSHLSLLIEI